MRVEDATSPAPTHVLESIEKDETERTRTYKQMRSSAYRNVSIRDSHDLIGYVMMSLLITP